ncbi:hypothetical protein ACQRIT_003009 [Beauveria bassiana]
MACSLAQRGRERSPRIIAKYGYFHNKRCSFLDAVPAGSNGSNDDHRPLSSQGQISSISQSLFLAPEG